MVTRPRKQNDDRLPEPHDPDVSSPLVVHDRWAGVHRFLQDNRNVKLFFLLLVIILATGIGLIVMLSQHKEPEIKPTVITKKPKPAPKFYSPLTGAETSEASTKRPITAIMIENSPEARPQSGLKDAGIVYEAIAEGGITRFVALYQESRPGLVGPVRSVRPYYVEWASAYDPAIAHVGGSQRALSMIRSGAYGVDMDQFFNGNYYWRANDRAAPHNVYTSFDKLDAMREAKGKTTSSFTGFQRQDSKKSATINASSISIDVSTGQFHVEYAYQADTNTYRRSQGGQAHVDREGGQISPAVVVAIKVPMGLGMEDGWREQITTTGSGQAYVFQNGMVTEGSWVRDSEKSPLQLRDAAGKDIVLGRGQTWITALAADRGVSW